MKQLPWLRAVGTVLVIGVAVAYLAFRYRLSDTAPIFRATDPMTQIAVVRYFLGDYAGAATMLSGGQSLGGSRDARLGFPGLAAFVSGDLKRAESDAKAALARDPRDEQARITLAQIALRNGDAKSAYSIARANIDGGAFVPFNSHVLAGIASTRMGVNDQALMHFTNAARNMEAGNRNSVMLTLMALIGEYKATDKLEQSPALAASMLRLLSFWEPSAMDGAARYATRAIAADKNASTGWVTLCAARFAKRQYQDALEACDTAGAATPNVDAQWLRAYIFAARGDLPRETEAVMKAIEIAPEDSFIADGTLRVLSEKVGDFPKVKALGEIALGKNPNDARTLIWVAHANTYLGQHSDALAQNQRAFTLSPTDPDIAMRVARSLRATGALTEALAAARETSALSPSWNVPYELAASIHFDRGEYIAAISANEAGFSRQAPTAQQLSSLCVAYLRAGQFESAAKCIDRVLAAEPNNALASRLRFEVNMNRDLAREEKKQGKQL